MQEKDKFEDAISKPFEISVVDFQGAANHDYMQGGGGFAQNYSHQTERQPAITSDITRSNGSKAHAYYTNSQ